MTHPHPKENFVPKAVLMKSGIKTLNTARQNLSIAAVSVNTVRPINTTYPRPTVNSARTTSNVFNRAHSHVRRPFNKSTTNKNNNLNDKVNTVKGNVNTTMPKAVVSDNKRNEANAVKALACWVWRPKQKEKGVIDSRCSRYKTGNKSYLSDYEEINGGFVAFRGDPKGGKITGKGKISTGKLDFEDVYFVKELNYLILSLDFKLLDENHVLLRVPRKDNMYSVGLKNIVPSGGIENLIDLKVKVIRCDNGTEFKNKVMNQFYEMKGKASVVTVPAKITYATIFGLKNPPFLLREPSVNQEQDESVNSTNNINTISSMVNTASIEDNVVDENIVYGCVDDPNMPNLEEIFYSDDDEDVDAKTDMTILGKLSFSMENSAMQPLDFQNCLFACFLSQVEPKKRAIRTKWIYKNKKDERGIVVRNKARLVAQGYTQEERIDYDEMDMKSAFLYGKIEEEVYVCQPLGFEDPEFPDRVYKVEKALYDLHQAPRAWPDIMFVVCACARFQVTPKVSHLHVVKRIFRYLKAEYVLHLVLWSSLWIQNQLLDYGYNFMNTKIFIDNESTICIVKNPVFHSKTKHIEIRHHFIRDSYKKRLIQVIKIHTDHNVADLLTKAFDIDDWNGLEMLRMKLGLKLCSQAKFNAARLLTTDRLPLELQLLRIKAAKPKAVTTAATTITTAVASTRPKAKGIKRQKQGKMVEPEKPLNKKDQIALDEELALRLHAKEQAELEKERVAQEEASRATIIEELDNIQAMIEADKSISSKKEKPPLFPS
ncbi:copia protein [Tanacetum coccineum]